ncbi:MAG TPA: type 1 glutamine amidotransferase [Candidatus Binatus sp.]|uniref:type 1 glutamine amidotransferase n=1 Tax=Candidatus Binatus sp. TaxID=2811406 RepID=UPI002B48A0A1|nr:type 1 glutamine amidotransferase [Candidatus Binatus sp.]HKN12934.1 type 1 glutamine amidotransferase [Candidatus Binatus sp.]
MAKIYVLQHHPVENLGTIADALEGAALAWQYVRVADGQPVPANMKGAGGLIVMGGPMGVYQTDRYPWLRDEMRLIEDAMKLNLPVLGVCLGAQILAAALGAKVDRNPNGKEIGWHPIRLHDSAKDDRLMRGLPATMTPFHWHGDIFDLPPGAISLASSEKTPCQAFRMGDQAYGFQFHFEVTREGVAAMAEAFAKELVRENIPADRMITQAAELTPPLENISEKVFSRWASPIQGI